MFAAFNYGQYRLYWLATAVSNVGVWMETLGQGWLAVLIAQQSGSPERAPLYVGLVGLARAVPAIILGLVGGAVADRMDRRRLIIIVQVAASIFALTVAALVLTQIMSITALAAIAAGRSVAYSFDMPARQAAIPRLVEKPDLMSAIGLQQTAFNGPQVAGPALAGILIATTGAVAPLFFAIGMAYLGVTLILLRMKPIPPLMEADRSVLRSIGVGLDHIRRDVTTFWVIALAATFAFFARPFVFLLPAFVAALMAGGATDLSLLMTAAGVGGFGGSFLIATLGSTRRPGALMLVAGGICGAALVS